MTPNEVLKFIPKARMISNQYVNMKLKLWSSFCFPCTQRRNKIEAKKVVGGLHIEF